MQTNNINKILQHFIKSNNTNYENIINIINMGANINTIDIYGNTILMKACLFYNFNLVKYLLLNGADVNIYNSKRDTAFIKACSVINNLDIIKELLLYGADINAQNYRGETALKKALINNDITTCNILLNNNIVINPKRNNINIISYDVNFDHIKSIDENDDIDYHDNINQVNNINYTYQEEIILDNHDY
jgi:ankyrin repeat protein